MGAYCLILAVFALQIAPVASMGAHVKAPAFLQVRMGPVMSHLPIMNLQQPTEATFQTSECPEESMNLPAFPYEFGWEMNIAVPHAYFLFRCSKLLSTKSCNSDLSAYYWFSPKHIVTKCDPPGAFLSGMNFAGLAIDAYLHNQHLPQWYPPPHAAFYRQKPITWPGQRTTGILLLNKNNHGGGGEQVNGGFIDYKTLSNVMVALQKQCPDTEVLYYRDWQFQDHEEKTNRETDTNDLNPVLEAKALAKNSNAHHIRDLPAQSQDPRETQMLTWSRFSCFLTVHGGNTDLAANFGGHMLTYIRGIDWYDTPATEARLAGLAKTSMKRVRSGGELLEGLPFLTQDGCNKCAIVSGGRNRVRDGGDA